MSRAKLQPVSAHVIVGRILVVEPDPATRHQVRRVLQGAGAIVDTASSHRQAVSRMLLHQYTAVFTATVLHGASSTSLIEDCRRLGQSSPFVLLSDDPYFERSPEAPDDLLMGVLSKPLDETELLELAMRAIAVGKQRRPPSIAPPNDSQRGLALVLDDNPGDVEFARIVLEGMGYEPGSIIEARRVQDALELVGQRHFAVAVVDLSLPDASGLDVIRQLYTSNPHLPIVVASGASRDVCEQALACGAQEIASKDSLMQELPGAIKRALLRKSADHDVRYRATHDAMTSLYNRAHFTEVLDRAVARMRRHSTSCAVIYIDLDGFKPINDTYGHSIGDEALKAIGTRLIQSLRDCDSAARLGGDEFAVLVEDVYDRAAVRPVAQRILRTLAEPIILSNGHSVRVSGSLGVAMCPVSGNNALDLMDAADSAMFVAKDAGGNQCCFAADLAPVPHDSRNRLSVDLKDAVANADFYVLFQPQVDLKTHSITGLEALLRWRRRNGPRVGPDQFVPMLEQSGMIVDVGAWVLREAVSSATLWSIRHKRRVRIAVNVSPQQLEQPGFAMYVQQVLKDARLAPELLELEITETVLMRDTGMIQRTLSELREAGVRIVLDDFGTGYASLSYLRRYRVDGLKIDRTFIEPLCEEQSARVLVGGIIDLAHQLDLEVVAEGVESLDQVRYLRDRACDGCQGYLFGRPHFLGDTRSSGVWNVRSASVTSESGVQPATQVSTSILPPATTATTAKLRGA
jgi:diguanylate cyclase (GGDEF)-like protein